MTHRIAVLVSILALLILTSCSTASKISEYQTELPTSSEDPLSIVISGLYTEGAQSIPTTPTPTFPFSPEKATQRAQADAYSHTQQYIRFTSIPATIEARGVRCEDGYILEQPRDVLSYSNEQWTLFTCSPASQSDEKKWTPGFVDYGERYTQVTKVDLSQTWIIQHDQFTYPLIDRPDAMLGDYRWTHDGKYVYLYPFSYPRADGFTEADDFLIGIPMLLRLDLETGEFVTILPDRPDAYAFALSPDDRLLVYSITTEPEIIHLIDMGNGDEHQIELEDGMDVSGSFVWDSTSTKVVFATGYGPGSAEPRDDISSTSIYILSIKSMHAQPIVYKDLRELKPEWCPGDSGYWIDADILCLFAGTDALKGWDAIFRLDIQTGALTAKPTPTATPEPTTQSP